MSEEVVNGIEGSGTVYEFLQGLAEPSAEELQMIEDELGWIDLVESLLEGLEA